MQGRAPSGGSQDWSWRQREGGEENECLVEKSGDMKKEKEKKKRSQTLQGQPQIKDVSTRRKDEWVVVSSQIQPSSYKNKFRGRGKREGRKEDWEDWFGFFLFQTNKNHVSTSKKKNKWRQTRSAEGQWECDLKKERNEKKGKNEPGGNENNLTLSLGSTPSDPIWPQQMISWQCKQLICSHVSSSAERPVNICNMFLIICLGLVRCVGAYITAMVSVAPL